MTLLAPLALLGLLTIPIILLLHLLRTRREAMLISSLRLWEGLQQKKQGVLPHFIPFSLLLLMQLCIAGALVLSMARPALSFLLPQPQHTTFILDTTSSMAAEDTGQPAPNNRFDVARQMIQTHLQNMGENDTFAVVSLNRRPKILLSGDVRQKEQASLALDDLRPGATGLNLPTALTLANGLIDPNRENQIIVLSDGNYIVDAGTLPLMRMPVTWQFIPPSSSTSNQALLNVSAQTWPDGRHRLFARVINYGDTPVNRTLRVLVNGQPGQETAIELSPQAETSRAWTLSPAAQTVMVEIVEPDAFPLDNRAELLLTGANQYQVLLISDAPEPEANALTHALEAQQGVELTITTSPKLSRHDPGNFDLIIFDGLPPTLAKWPDGNVLAINPPANHPLLSSEGLVQNLRPDATTASSLLSGIDLSGVYFNQAARLSLPPWAEADLTSFPLTGKNVDDPNFNNPTGERQPLIFHGAVGDTRLTVWAFDLTQSNLAGRLALPLLTANTLSSLAAALPSSVVALGEPVSIDHTLRVETPDGRRLFLPSPEKEEDLSVFSYTKQPGLYTVYNQSDKLIGGFAVHAGSALESNLTTHFQPDALASANSIAAIEPETKYFEFWPWLAGLVLLVVAVEGWLAWRR